MGTEISVGGFDHDHRRILEEELRSLLSVPGPTLLEPKDETDRILEQAEEVAASRDHDLEDDRLLGTLELEYLTGFSDGTVRRLLVEGDLPGFQIAGRWFVSLRYWREWVAVRSRRLDNPRLCIHGFSISHWLPDLTTRCEGPI